MSKNVPHLRHYCSLPRLPHPQRSNGWKRWLLLLLLAGSWLLLPLAQGASAQTPTLPPSENSPIQLDVEVGFDNAYRQNQWLPITVTITNHGPDVEGVVEWSFAGFGGYPVQREIELPRGAHKQLKLAAFAQRFLHAGQVRLLTDDHELARKEVRFDPIEANRFVVGVVSSDETLLNSLAAMQIAGTSGTTVLHVDLDDLPENTRLLDIFDAIFLHDKPTSTLNTSQLEALDMWVRFGGELIVSGGASTNQSVPGVSDLVPVIPDRLMLDTSLRPLFNLVGRNTATPYPTHTTTTLVTLKEDAVSLDGANLLTLHNHGSGRVLFSAFDLRVLRSWSEEASLWQLVLRNEPRFSPTTSSLRLHDVLEFPALHLPSFTVLLIYVLGYIILVGPINFLLLRLFRRTELAWITIPGLVVIFIAATYGTNLLVRGTRPEMLQLAVVQGFEDTDRGFATAYMGLFSPYRQNYTLSFAPESLVNQQRLSLPPREDTAVVWNDSATEVHNTIVDVASLSTFIVERHVNVEAKVGSNLEWQNNGMLEGKVENLGNKPLTDALLLYGNSASAIGDIAPGETKPVQLHADQNNFPGMTTSMNTDPTKELFDRRLILSMFFGGFLQWRSPAPAQDSGMPPDAGVYLLAWSERPLLAAEVNNAPPSQQGLTLYIIRLDSDLPQQQSQGHPEGEQYD